MSAYIKWIQETLKVLGYDSGAVDGVNGEKTDATIRKFQKENGLVMDGLVGEKTHDALLIAKAMVNLKLDQDGKLVLKNFAKDEFTCI